MAGLSADRAEWPGDAISAHLEFSGESPFEALDAVLLIGRAGAVIDAWTRDGVSRDAITVMAGTLVGSIEGLNEAMGGLPPRRVSFTMDCRRVVVERVRGDVLLLMAAPSGAPARVFRSASRWARRRLASSPARARGESAQSASRTPTADPQGRPRR